MKVQVEIYFLRVGKIESLEGLWGDWDFYIEAQYKMLNIDLLIIKL